MKLLVAVPLLCSVRMTLCASVCLHFNQTLILNSKNGLNVLCNVLLTYNNGISILFCSFTLMPC